jgi:ribosomal protein S18 acetylase RimI-like enzyme
MIVIRELTPDELQRAREIDVSESGCIICRCAGGEIRAVVEEWHRPSWSAAEWQETIEKWTVEHKWDVMLGAFASERLVGMASLRYRLTDTTAQLVSLHVSRDARRQGVATKLLQEIVRLAREGGAEELYVSATPSESAVGFYLKQGFRPTADIDKRLHALEPEDIHMVRPL